MKYLFLFSIIALFFACSENNTAGGTSEEAEGIVAIKNREITGVTQKGPFLVGSSVAIQELDGETLVQTGRSFKTSVKSDLGDFSVKNVNLASQYALLEVTGYFYNEVTGKKSEGMISLNALTDLTNRNNVNVNVLTHLEADRVLNLVQKQGLSFAEAKKQAESEIFSSFGFTSVLESPEDMDIFSEGDYGSDALFALSVLMLGNGSVADFSERLALAARSFAERGEWHGPEKGEVADWAYQLESEEYKEDVEHTILSKIYDNVDSWNLRDEPPYLYAPYINGLLYVFWTKEYDLGPCDRNHSGDMKKVTNIHSKYYNKEFVCYFNNDYRCTDDGIGCRWYLAEDPVKYVEENRENLPDMEIGDVFWATENLKYDFHDTVNAKNACYRDVPRYCEMYGTLYDYRTALKACPDGYRLPKYGEVENLLQYYGGAGKNAADSLLVMNDYERGISGFQALLGGHGEYEGLNENTALWISSDDSIGTRYVLWIDSSTAEIRPYSSELAYVRCVFDVDSLAAIQEYDVMSDSRDDQLYHYTNVSFDYIDNEMVTTRMRRIYVLVENVHYDGDSLYSWNDAVEVACPEGWRLPNIYEWISIFRSHGDDPSFVLSEDSLQTVVYYNVGRTDYPYYQLFGKDKKNTYWTSTEGVIVNSLGENVSAGQVVNMNTAEHNRYDVRMLLDDKLEKHSVRCVKDADLYNY
ncbi:FISUMP domain-containing protein [Fibrobacter sp. UWH4]|uniref:FISUMP domain-containing protein n=1 Tax=Fibrobacter sp. UWH4 TaxID=1896210 RepID=UPI00091EC6D4|nr:FISUMP domain-containing protein [Fibrobacter sp. UWH4]SHL25413.1 major paralogous domain-containing protein [Fibrobacter sp. UWH4]